MRRSQPLPWILVGWVLFGALLSVATHALAEGTAPTPPAPPSAAATPTTTATPAAAAVAGAAPRISFSLKEIDFGQAVQGEAVERSFPFKNTGDAPLVIRRVKPSCGCTAALATEGEIAPGAKGEIKLTFSTGERTGFQSVEVHVFHNDALEADAGPQAGTNLSVLRLRGEVVQLVSMMPMSLYFESFARGTAVERRVTVLPTDRPSIQALKVESPYPWLRARAEPWKRGGKTGFEVICEVAKDAPIGQIDEPIVVTTDHPRQARLRIPAFGQVHGKVVSFPSRIDMNERAQDGEKTPTIFLMRVAEGDGLAIDGIETPPELTAETIEVIPGRRAEVALKLRPGARPGPFSGVVRIFLRDAEQPLFEVPVAGEVPRKVTIDPPAVWLGGAEASVTVRVGGAKVLGIEVRDEAGKASPVAQAASQPLDGVGGQVKVNVAPGAAAGPLRATLVIRTDARGEETIEVPIRGLVGK